jgi:uncharacterized protein (TIGR03790 family)
MTRAFVASLALITSVAAQEVATPEWDPVATTSIIFNADFPESEALATFYAQQRGISPQRLIALHASKEEAITREAFNATIRDPLLSQLSPDTQVLAIIHGVPSKIMRQQENPKPSREDEASVDSELACLRMSIHELAGTRPNPFFNKPARFSELQDADGMLLVGRLDAATPDIVRRMITDAIAVEKIGLRGRAVIDLALKPGAYEEGDEWLRRSALLYKTHGIPCYVDRYQPVLREGWPLPDTALYFGWYTDPVAGVFKPESFQFKRGAVVCHLHSFSASIIRTTTQNWAGPLLAHGATATLGNVWEPYLSLTVHFDIFNDRLLKGAPLAEAAWCATPGLSWMNVVLGDPLYRPFANSALGVDRDYAIYKGIAEQHAEDADSRELKREVLEAARTRNSPQLIEFLALLSSQESKPVEAIGLLQHARSLYSNAADRLRTIIYEVELLRRDNDRKQIAEALALLQRAAADEVMKSADGYALVLALIKEIGG